MGVHSLPKTVTRQRRGCDLNPGPSAPESSMLTTRLPSHPKAIEKEEKNASGGGGYRGRVGLAGRVGPVASAPDCGVREHPVLISPRTIAFIATAAVICSFGHGLRTYCGA